MNDIINIQRRKLLQYGGFALAAAATYPNLLFGQHVPKKSYASPDFSADVEIELRLETAWVSIFAGKKTRVWKTYGQVLKGPDNAVTNLPDTYLAPTISLRKGQKVRIYLKNNLPAASILHWHGLHVPAAMDGNPLYAINRGETYVYEFEILNRAGTYWYHSHTHSVTAKQVYSGLAGFFIVSDAEEQKLPLPRGAYDIPLVIQDRSFDSQNQLRYVNNMMQRMQGFLGDYIFVNGQPDYVLPVESRAYRFRILNGSNSRIYKLAWDDGTPLTVIGVDGGLLERPENYSFVTLGPAERREIWFDFSGRKVGTELTLRSIPFSASDGHGMMGRGMMGRGMMGGRRGGMGGGPMMAGSSLPLGGDYPLFKVKVVKQSTATDTLPERLTPIKHLQLAAAANTGRPRSILLSMRHMSALLNGRSYKMNDIRPDEIIPLNTLQIIEFNNGFHGGMHGMMAMPHPMHLHGEQFQVVKREVNTRFMKSYRSVADGFVDEGWKDTVLVMPGEKVTILKPFNDFEGLFMYHCHNLEHEDMGMMRDFLIK